MPKYGSLVVEGPHDVEFIYRLLSPFGLSRVRLLGELDPFFLPLVPTSYPPDGDLQKRVSVPLFLRSSTHVIAINSAGGDSRLVDMIEENSVLIRVEDLHAIGLLLDSDSAVSAIDRYSKCRDRLRDLQLEFPNEPGVVAQSTPRVGGFVLPDNQTQGTLESVLMECAGTVYPNLLASATAHVATSITDSSLVADDLKDIRKPSGSNKAIIGSIAAILRPGKAVQVSIQDNRWLRGEALSSPQVKAVQTFLANLFDLHF